MRVLGSAFVVLAIGAAGCSSTSTENAGTPHSSAATSARSSKGCDGDPIAPGRSEVTVRSGDRDRAYLRYIPRGLKRSKRAPSTVACEQPEKISVLATVSGLWDPPDCAPSKHVPVVSLHGTGDHFLPFDGGVGDRIGMLQLSPETSTGLISMATRPGAVAASTAWANRNGCRANQADDAIVDTVSRTKWTGCNAAVELYVIDGGSHTWPGSNGMAGYEGLLGPVSHAISANQVIWDFFTAHRGA